jgi:hemerythrin
VAERLAIFYAHMREHFGREEGAMEQEIFPLFRTHQEEHARVLAQLADESRLFRETGDATELVPFVSLNWPAWSRSHIQSMDLTAARFLCASET